MFLIRGCALLLSLFMIDSIVFAAAIRCGSTRAFSPISIM